ncbi:MAG: chloride channel protein [Clostridium sp.]|jgi:H+/Cl- antiporter ClcA|uniref:chloride channel protein n=1 Tax=Clostridium sp. TaxID=1506 RepID=UPI0025C64494|nr:chloride channel protein [Clostridium sp.]MCH3965940.1 chloride channel protein [Clostridium sp.]MCI1715971.1 chloride channel protein [Clostridium sp.]MCI1800357.1 chloride channel protein [Clostridium sp.]MCI1814148.1 chloride channel protein [Clostridium sp.]MCI1871047.1 chloride channel protein [Clostridium sp.]
MKSSRKLFINESIFIASTLKWTFLSVIIGLLVGSFMTLFIKIIVIGVDFTSKFKFYYLFLPLALFLSSFIILKLAPDAKGHGTEKVIESVNKNNGNMNINVVPVKLLTTFITIIFGGSVGLEGPATQIGGAISSFIGQITKMNIIDRRRLVVCGISAGFVSIFNAPVGAAIFACEVLYIGKISYIALVPSLISSFVSYYIGLYMGNKPLIFTIKYLPNNQITAFLEVFVFGIIIGFLAILFINLVKYVEKFFKQINIYVPLKGIIGGILIIGITYMFNSFQSLGIGDGIITRIVSGEKFSNSLFINKSLVTALTLGSGGSGGILTPMLFIGSSFGNAWAQITGSNAAFYSALGMTSFLAACSNIPISSIIIAMELFGNQVGIYSAIAIGISYIIVGHKSIYPTQLVIYSKTPSVSVDKDIEISDIKEHIVRRFFTGN